MKTSVATILALAPFVASQDSSFAGTLVKALQGAGLNQLATAATAIANTTRGQFLFNNLPNGNFTIFAPNDAAFKAVPASVSSNKDGLADIISYHALTGSFPASAFANAPNVTIARTLLNGSTFLEGGKNQVLVAQAGNGTVNILNQPKATKVLNTTVVGNIILHVVDNVLTTPPSLAAALKAGNFTALTTALTQTGLLDTVASLHGVTVFAPTDAAFAAATQALGSQATNTTLIKAILLNHVVSGQTLYSTSLASDSTPTSAGGQQFKVALSSNGSATVTSGSATANIIKTDVLVQSGVVHVIDAVLANGASNAEAAAGAASSASSAATQSTATAAETGPVGPSQSAGGSSGGQTGDASRVGMSSALLLGAVALFASL